MLDWKIVETTEPGVLLGTNDSRVDAGGHHTIQLPPYACRWYRPGGMDGRLARHGLAE